MDAQLEQALARGDVETVRRRLAAGADVDARDRRGQTALMRAAHEGDAAMVAALLEHGADPNASAKHHLNALMLAVVAGHAEIALMLARAGADLHARATGPPGFAGKTAAELARERGMAELGEMLERG
ncbi:MAG TPA: ankyrin repeat domain-containing protein [Pelomicrobium sp.]|nr:ankyrin repeat domain-containing protein [Pelomicrobium sp.]